MRMLESDFDKAVKNRIMEKRHEYGFIISPAKRFRYKNNG